MLNSKQFLDENYKNLIGSDPQKEIWADRVWKILQSSYTPIGGIKGTGFETKQRMIDAIPFWKLFVRGEEVLVAVFYKDKGGRKTVAIATNGSEESKSIIQSIMRASLKVAYGEKSGPALATLMKSVSFEELQPFLLSKEQVEKLGQTVRAVSEHGLDMLDQKDKFTWEKFPSLRPYFYMRELDGSFKMKVAVGTPNLNIFN